MKCVKNNIFSIICILGFDKIVYFLWCYWFNYKIIIFLFLKNDNIVVVICICIFNIFCLCDLVFMLIGIYMVKKVVKLFIVLNYFEVVVYK